MKYCGKKIVKNSKKFIRRRKQSINDNAKSTPVYTVYMIINKEWNKNQNNKVCNESFVDGLKSFFDNVHIQYQRHETNLQHIYLLKTLPKKQNK